jgi:protein ImuA
MPLSKKDIILQLQRDILPLQGIKPPTISGEISLGPLDASFPNKTFPTAAIHECVSPGVEHAAAATGFLACLLSALMRKGGACVWISAARTLFPPALKAFGVEPDRIIFIDLKREKDVLWAMEEALKCEGLAAVVGEVQDIGFTASRRLQLAVEASRVTGFILRNQTQNLSTVACVARWKVTPLHTVLEDDLPGVGFPRWQVELLKIRNGKPGSWQMEWSVDRFRVISEAIVHEEERRQTG